MARGLTLDHDEIYAIALTMEDEVSAAYRMTETHTHEPYWAKRYAVLKNLEERIQTYLGRNLGNEDKNEVRREAR